MSAPPVLITGATGRQGGATARALLEAGHPVRALVRDPAAEKARALAGAGAELVTGDLDDLDSLVVAFRGARAAFSIQMPDMNNLLGDGEMRQAANIATAARTAGLEQIVHTSVSGTGGWREVPGLAEGAYGEMMAHYWHSKWEAEEAVRTSGVKHWTVLRPSTFLDLFAKPSYWFEGYTSDRMITPIRPDTPLPMIAVRDIGVAAAAAFADPERFAGVNLELAGGRWTLREVAAALSEAYGTTIEPPSTTHEEAVALGLAEPLAAGHGLMDRHPAPADPSSARELGIPLTGLREWAATL